MFFCEIDFSVFLLACLKGCSSITEGQSAYKTHTIPLNPISLLSAGIKKLYIVLYIYIIRIFNPSCKDMLEEINTTIESSQVHPVFRMLNKFCARNQCQTPLRSIHKCLNVCMSSK